MALPKRKPREDDPQKRWRSDAHRAWMTKNYCCAACGTAVNVQAAHVSMGSEPGMGLKTDDWRCVPLCGSTMGREGCHDRQHRIGEPAFWNDYREKLGQDVEDLILSLCKASPKSAEIAKAKWERGL